MVRHFLQNEAQYREIAALFQIGAATVHRWVEQFNRAGTVSRAKSTGRPSLVAPSGHEKLKEFVLSNSDKSLAVLSDKWQEKSGQKLSISILVDSMTEAKKCITPKTCEGFFAHSSSFHYLC